MFYIVYETTNSITGKIYVGMHKQKLNPHEYDGYLGSGKLLNLAIDKYGESAFSRRTLFVFDNLEDCKLKEKEIVDRKFIEREDTYNIAEGGTGGNTMLGFSDDERSSVYRRIGDVQRGVPVKPEFYDAYRERMLAVRIQPMNKGRVHTEESRQNMAAANHMNGARYITNGLKNLLLYEGDEMPLDFYFGRTLSDDQKFKGHSPDILKKLSERRTGKIYITDGVENKLWDDSDIPTGWSRGLTKVLVKRRFANNGAIEKQIPITEELPNGWVYGRKKRNK